MFKTLLNEDSTFRNSVTEDEFDEQEAIQWTQYLWNHGFPVGPASGVNFGLAVRVAKSLPTNSIVVTIFTDRMERYFTTPIFEEIKKDIAEKNSERVEEELYAKLKNKLLQDRSFLKAVQKGDHS